ncbi:unnamed protein product [Symbiodinium microadriaticum]|nr:unnamed protein product [Symbiodinium microadriaticum]
MTKKYLGVWYNGTIEPGGTELWSTGYQRDPRVLEPWTILHMALVTRLQILAALVAVAAANSNALPKDSKAYRMLACDACRIVMNRLSRDVKFLTETRKIWPDAVLDQRLSISCEDPSHPSGSGVEACSLFMQDHADLIRKEVKLRWDEASDEFEEDIVATEFCSEKARICDVDAKGISHMIDEASRKEKLLKEEREEKERIATKTQTR